MTNLATTGTQAIMTQGDENENLAMLKLFYCTLMAWTKLKFTAVHCPFISWL